MKVSGRFVQIVVGVLIIAGLFYGGIKGFTLWQEREARRTAVAMHDVRRPLSLPDVEPESPATQMQPVHTEPTEPAHTDTAISQPVPSEPNDPGLKDARSVAGGFGMSAPSSSGEPQARPVVCAPPPTGEAKRKSSEAVSEEVKIDARRVNTPTAQSELAHKLADKANETTDDPAKRMRSPPERWNWRSSSAMFAWPRTWLVGSAPFTISTRGHSAPRLFND